MKRLKLFMFIFFICLCIPMAYFVLRTQQSLDQEEMAELRYFADTLFFEMETEFSNFVNAEESRAVDEYNYPSGLSEIPEKRYILGYFQNNPDGSFQTPIIENRQKNSNDKKRANGIRQGLNEANTLFNLKRTDMPARFEETVADVVAPEKKQETSIADKYIDLSRMKEQKAQLGQKAKRVENITVRQALKLSQQETNADAETFFASDRQVEVDPLQSVFIDGNRIVLFRRIVIDNRIYRQGLVLLVDKFLDHLTQSYFLNQPMARFARLNLSVSDQGDIKKVFEMGAGVQKAKFSVNRRFPRPFSFLSATLTCENIPRSPGRSILNAMMTLMAVVIGLGLFAIYRSARTVVDMSEKRSQFVSSVTHELKTPLTNIRMYIEMLEQGIAPTPEREQDYLRILGAESSRLSGLINNVLEFSRLEKKKSPVEYVAGNFRGCHRRIKKYYGRKITSGRIFPENPKKPYKSLFIRPGSYDPGVDQFDGKQHEIWKECETKGNRADAETRGRLDKNQPWRHGTGNPPAGIEKCVRRFFSGR